MKQIIKLTLQLFIVAAVTTALLAMTYAFTLEPIANQIRMTQEKMMKAILPQAADFKEMSAEKSGNIVRIFEASNENGAIGYVVELAPSGYGGAINMVVGISKADNAVAGMRVLKHSETPGLGALSATEKFYRKYDNKGLTPLKVVKASPRADEIDAITSATITTNAVTAAVNEAIEWYQGSDLK